MSTSPAEMLEGRDIDGGWHVAKLIKRSPLATGGNFSVGYLVEKSTGERGYLKAMNIMSAMQPGVDMMRILQHISEAFNYERNICRKCTERHLSNVVQAITDGYCLVNSGDPLSNVPYLIFELAQHDIRTQLDSLPDIDLAWMIRSIHNVAVGISQLHGASIVHQDIKPSNVLVFDKSISKIADLGRSSSKHDSSPFDSLLVAGDKTYAPPELLYRTIPNSWDDRMNCDLYHLGSLIAFIFTRTHFNSLLLLELTDEHSWHNWGGTYEEVLPFIHDAYAKSLERLAKHIPNTIQPAMIECVSYLCHPEPQKRGHPLNKIGHQNPYALDRFISIFDNTAKKLELEAIRGK